MRSSYQFRITLLSLCCLVAGLLPHVRANDYTIVLDRGKLWHAFHLAQECEPMADWERKTFGLDWPGYRTEEIKENIGGSHSYLVAGGFFITAKTDSGTVWGWDNFATHDTDVGFEGDQFRYLVSRDAAKQPIHRKRWPNGENYWLQTNPFEAEEVIESQWEMNGAWYQPWDNQNLPVAVRRIVRQWSGSQADENYLIIEFTLSNLQRRNSLKGVYLLFTYAVSANHRGWNLTYPNFPDGARNTRSTYDPAKMELIAWAGDFAGTPGEDDSFDPFNHLTYEPITNRSESELEFVAPGFLGLRFLAISPDSNGIANRVNGFAWSAAAPSNDHSGPFLGVAGLENKYAAMANPRLLSEAFEDANDPRMGQSRLYANFSLGPFNIPRRDSIKIIMAEFVGGMSYEQAIQPHQTQARIMTAGDSATAYLSARIDFNFQHQFTVPTPPPAPDFTVSAFETPGTIGNVIQFGPGAERVPDPHQGVPDLAGYRIYRSGKYPFGPWEMIAEIPAASQDYFDPNSQLYTFVDTRVPLGYGFYYSVTSFDTGHPAWAVDARVTVPSLETSVFANRTTTVFYTTLKPTESVLEQVSVVPNPFYRSSGFQLAGDAKLIQFVNLSRTCTIRIYSLRGDLVKTIEHANETSGVAYWNQISDYGQYVKSGMYFYHISNPQGEEKTGKFAIIN